MSESELKDIKNQLRKFIREEMLRASEFPTSSRKYIKLANHEYLINVGYLYKNGIFEYLYINDGYNGWDKDNTFYWRGISDKTILGFISKLIMEDFWKQ